MASKSGQPIPGEELTNRTGLPEDLRVLAARYPRETWQGHRNLGEMARFWLERHGMFRELGAAMADGSASFRADQIAAKPFVQWLAPRFNYFLSELHMHHNVEDHHYFPRFREADARLARGFDILDADHVTIDRFIHELAESGVALEAAIRGGGDLPGASARLGERLDATLTVLTRHLDDEEDIVVPLIIDRTEASLGLG